MFWHFVRVLFCLIFKDFGRCLLHFLLYFFNCFLCVFALFLFFWCVFWVFCSRFFVSFLTFFTCFFDVVLRSGKGARGGTDPPKGIRRRASNARVSLFPEAPHFLPNSALLGAVAGAGARQNLSNKKNVLSLFFVFFCVVKFFCFFTNQQKKHAIRKIARKNNKQKKTKKLKKTMQKSAWHIVFCFSTSKNAVAQTRGYLGGSFQNGTSNARQKIAKRAEKHVQQNS